MAQAREGGLMNGGEIMAILNAIPVTAFVDDQARDIAIARLRARLHEMVCTAVDMEVLLDAAAGRMGTVDLLAREVGIKRLRRGNTFVDEPPRGERRHE